MSATDELRRLLDERGVEGEDHSGSIEQRTVYRTPNGWCYVSTANDKWLSYVEYHDMTPKQAVEATLGRGTCRALDGESSSGAPLQAGDYDEFWEPAGVCSECGELIPLRNYCPNCGRKVVEP